MRKVHRLRVLREAQNLTREQLAQELGIGAATIKRAERGEPIGAESRQRLCAFFGRSSEDLGLVVPDALVKQNEEEQAESSTARDPLYSALVGYVEQQRSRLTSAFAPGTTTLRVGEIIGAGSLFIPPPWKLLHGPTPAQPLTDYLLEALVQRHRLLLLGDAGQGKTTVLKLVFVRLADRFLGDPSSPLPVYISLREYASFSGNVLDILWEHVGEDFPLPYELFTSLVRNKRLVFLFDGFDEIPGEMTQRSINERGACNIFRYPSLLSCRKSFFDFYLSMSPLQEVYSEQVELQPLQALSDAVIHYIAAFYQHQAVRMGIVAPATVIEAIRRSPELQDLVGRPLLLQMILDVFASTAGDLDEKQWSITKLYRRYCERWLKHEAGKPDSVLRWDEKVAMLQEAAWFTYRGNVGFPSALSEHVTFTHEELQMFVKGVVSRYSGVSAAQLLDDLAYRCDFDEKYVVPYNYT